MPKSLLKIETVPGVSYEGAGHYKTKSGLFKGIVIHYTVSGREPRNAVGVVKHLANSGLAALVMDVNGTLYKPEGWDFMRQRGAHAGISEWNGLRGLNSYYLGIEICCWGRGSKVGPIRSSSDVENIVEGDYQEFSEEQEKSLINFCLWALDNNPELEVANICGHDEAREKAGRRGDKTDPGASLSMTMPEFRKNLNRLTFVN